MGSAVAEIVDIFQSTHPLRGATRQAQAGLQGQRISIHAPLAGCDLVYYPQNRVIKHFNPRTPCGVRRTCRRGPARRPYFNPRTPCGVRLGYKIYFDISQIFQSTHPLRGATLTSAAISRSCRRFQSTHPLRGATESRRSPAETGLISIHAPLAGCDRRTCHADVTDQISIHAPLAGCDQPGWQDQEAGWISIHAPLAGCDGR